ncbi:MAG TPA: hypothetical protein VK550_27785 [Polyangiaceae bacterium]|nr:hypothetical protein [Polyangiaceae bacterium]
MTSTLSSEDLQRHGIRSLAEAINFLSVGMVSQESLIGGRQQVGARGVTLLNNFASRRGVRRRSDLSELLRR